MTGLMNMFRKGPTSSKIYEVRTRINPKEYELATEHVDELLSNSDITWSVGSLARKVSTLTLIPLDRAQAALDEAVDKGRYEVFTMGQTKYLSIAHDADFTFQ